MKCAVFPVRAKASAASGQAYMSDFGLADLPESVSEGPEADAYFRHLNGVIFKRFSAGEREPDRLIGDMPSLTEFRLQRST